MPTKQFQVEYTEFYNTALDHMDLMKEYYIWQVKWVKSIIVWDLLGSENLTGEI